MVHVRIMRDLCLTQGKPQKKTIIAEYHYSSVRKTFVRSHISFRLFKYFLFTSEGMGQKSIFKRCLKFSHFQSCHIVSNYFLINVEQKLLNIGPPFIQYDKLLRFKFLKICNSQFLDMVQGFFPQKLPVQLTLERSEFSEQ